MCSSKGRLLCWLGVVLLGAAAARMVGWRAQRGAVSRVPGTWLAAPPTLFQLCADGLTDGELMRKRGNIQPDTPGAVVAGAV